jgi:peptide/nickel transport system substrate-binding protein
MEKLRDAYVQASTPEGKKKAAEEVQRRFVEIVTHVHLGEWRGVSAVRGNIGTRTVPPPVTTFWGVTKK